jgi:hypothetical protein
MAIKVAVLFFPIPGGLGVLEGTSVALLAPAIPDYTLLGGLLAYRILYYLVPFAIALAILIVYELGVRSGLVRGIGSRFFGSRRRLRDNSGDGAHPGPARAAERGAQASS